MRANSHFQGGSRFATVIGSALTDLEQFAAIRHRIAHDSIDARTKFDAASMHFVAKRFPGSRPGILLRQRLSSTQNPVSWLERICDDLESLAFQLAP